MLSNQESPLLALLNLKPLKSLSFFICMLYNIFFC
ncbi:unnamed protein product [Brassica napus]|uniref:(rape) hypothetical protein n=1 Tax=Brassica napus TaxID=3708 RepID=A0A816LAT2_BRANA|nr:unnamed protein product [Brassica napus]